MGKHALKVVSDFWQSDKELAASADERATFVEWATDPGHKFVYKNPDSEVLFLYYPSRSALLIIVQHNKGAFQSELVLKVFEHHLAQVKSSALSFGDPIGGLAISCAAVRTISYGSYYDDSNTDTIH